MQALSDLHGVPVLGPRPDPPAHPTGLETRRVAEGGPLDRDGARARGADRGPAPAVPVAAQYAAEFADGLAIREEETGIQLAVENMFPWRARQREMLAYLPHWDPVGQPFDHVTLDLSHTATAGSDALEMAHALGERLAPSTSPTAAAPAGRAPRAGTGTQPCGELLELLAGNGFEGSIVIEVVRGGTPRAA